MEIICKINLSNYLIIKLVFILKKNSYICKKKDSHEVIFYSFG